MVVRDLLTKFGTSQPDWLTLSQMPKILYLSKFKAFADNNIDVSKTLIFVLGRVENIVGNGENAGYRHFLLFPQCFQKPVLPEP